MPAGRAAALRVHPRDIDVTARWAAVAAGAVEVQSHARHHGRVHVTTLCATPSHTYITPPPHCISLRAPSRFRLNTYDRRAFSGVVNEDLTFKAKDLKSEQVEGPLYIRGVKEHKKTKNK